MRACWLKWVGRDWSISADYIWLNYSGANSVKAYDWPTKALAKSLPKPDCPIVYTSLDEKDCLSFVAFGIDRDGYDKYIKACKKKGYKDIEYSYDSSFCAKDKKGRELMIGYSDRDQRMDVSVSVD